MSENNVVEYSSSQVWEDLAEKDPLLIVGAVTEYCLIRLDLNGLVRSWNPAAESIKGYKAQEILGRSFSTFYPRVAVDTGIPAQELVVASRDGRFEDEGWRVRKDGSEFWANVLITPLRDEDGVLRGFAKLVRDLTGRRSRDRELASATATITGVLEKTSDGIIEVDRDWVIVHRNRQAFETMPKYGLERKLWDLFPKLIDSDAGCALQASMESRTEARYENFSTPDDGWYRISAYPTEKGLSIAFSNISLESARSRESQKQEIIREKRIASMSHLAGGLAHEIINPLAIMHALASDLRRAAIAGSSALQEESVQACDGIVDTAERAMAILRGLKSFSREASRDEMLPASLVGIAKGCIAMQQSRFDRHGIKISLDAELDIPDIFCREVQIGQILANLITNAFESISSANPKERWVSINLMAVDKFVRAEVTDSGPGVDAEIRQRLMQPFVTTKEGSGGTGIGLSLSRGIAQNHGGDLTYRTSGQSFCFRLTLPTRQVGVASKQDLSN